MNTVEFGTDGVRGAWGVEVNAQTGYRVAIGAAQVLGASGFVIVSDTRPFNPELAEGIFDGLRAEGMSIHDAGILPTPAAAILADELSSELGRPMAAISLSASHNPVHDAGIKVFGVGGIKLSDAETRQVEAAANAVRGYTVSQGTCTQTSPTERLQETYVSYVLDTVEEPLRTDMFLTGKTIVVDAANGAAYRSAPRVLATLGARVVAINADPLAEINKNCGATKPGTMVAEAGRVGAYYGMALDGDADRNIGYDVAHNRILDGDDALAIATSAMIHGGLHPNGIAATAYSNLGLKVFMNELGIRFFETENGDRSVSQAMHDHGLLLGGEYTGHTLYGTVARRLRRVLTGDGTVTALQELQAAAFLDKLPGDISNWKKLPYILESIRLPEGISARELMVRPEVIQAIGTIASAYDGRLHVRPSGTEPVVRVLANGYDDKRTRDTANKVTILIREAAS